MLSSNTYVGSDMSLRHTLLAILDWMMPGMDGPDICRKIRETENNAYIVLLSSKEGSQSTVEGLEAGADDYITKPIDLRELRRVLEGASGRV